MLGAFVLAFALFAASPDQDLAERAYKATALLYSQDQAGGLLMRCTATAFEHVTTGYLFVTAAHCIGPDNEAKERSATGTDIPFFITFDEKDTKMFYPARVVAVGYQHKGHDFAIFFVETRIKDWGVIPIGDESKEKVDNEVFNIASPLGLGLQVFHGTITSLFLDRPVVQDSINWRGSLILSINVGSGSSGSAVISTEQEAIIGFIVGGIQSGSGTPNVIAIPVSRFSKFVEEFKQDAYKYFKLGDTN